MTEGMDHFNKCEFTPLHPGPSSRSRWAASNPAPQPCAARGPGASLQACPRNHRPWLWGPQIAPEKWQQAQRQSRITFDR